MHLVRTTPSSCYGFASHRVASHPNLPATPRMYRPLRGGSTSSCRPGMDTVLRCADVVQLVCESSLSDALWLSKWSLPLDPLDLRLGGPHDSYSGLQAWIRNVDNEVDTRFANPDLIIIGSSCEFEMAPGDVLSEERGFEPISDLIITVSTIKQHLHTICRRYNSHPECRSPHFEDYCNSNRHSRHSATLLPHHPRCFTARFLERMWAEDLQNQLEEHERSRLFFRALIVLTNLRTTCTVFYRCLQRLTKGWTDHVRLHRKLLTLPAVSYLVSRSLHPRSAYTSTHVNDTGPVCRCPSHCTCPSHHLTS